MQKKNVLIFFTLVMLTAVNVLAQSKAWRIEHAEWTPSHEARYEQFVAKIGAAVSSKVCGTVKSCMSNATVNPYHATDPADLKLYADCADLPYFLRAYFAWKNQLPFGFVKSVRPNVAPGDVVRDIRYTKLGNIVKERYDVVTRNSSTDGIQMVDGVNFLNRVLPNQISSAIFRIGYVGMDADNAFADFYSIRVDKNTVRPGTVVYDPNGHVITIYQVTADGRALYVDAHPDNSLTSGMFDARFSRSNPGQGAGFKNWRPLRLVGATYDPVYGLVGGKLVGAKDAGLPGYSLEQYYGTNSSPEWKKSEFSLNGQKFGYYDFVRHRLASGVLRIDPLIDMKNSVQQLCSTVKERVDAVQTAIVGGIHLQDHPERLPRNIFGADGDWETYASPSRDARLRDSFKQLRDYVATTIEDERKNDGTVVYNGNNLARDLLAIYHNESVKCKVTYINSESRPVTLNLEDVRARLYGLSFDPYHCVELRWGAQGQELSSCRDNQNKRDWYDKEIWMRYQHERNTEAVMNYSLDEITGPMGFGASAGKDTDISAYLMQKM